MKTDKICKDDYVIIKNGEPLESLDIIYHKTSMQDVIEDGFELEEGEEWVKMTDLPKHLLDRYIENMEFDK